MYSKDICIKYINLNRFPMGRLNVLFAVLHNISHEVGIELQPGNMHCDVNGGNTYVTSSQASVQIVLTLSVVVMFVVTKKLFTSIKQEMAQLTVVIVGAGPIGLTSAMIAVQCKRVDKVLIYEEQSRTTVENKTYQIALRPSNVTFFKSYGVDFDNLEGIWEDGCFYTRVCVYLEYILHVLPSYNERISFRFGTKFNRDCSGEVDQFPGRKLVICCDGRNGGASRVLGISDETIHHSTGAYGALAALERSGVTLVPRPEQRIHNITFDLSAYVANAYEDDGRTNFTFKLFGNSEVRHMALAVYKSDSKIIKALRVMLDKSMMRNIFLKCFNMYKQPDETGVSDSYCLNNMKFSPRLFEIKLLQRAENVAYISDLDLFIISEGEAARAYNFNTGMDVNIGIKGLAALQPFIDRITLAETEYSIMTSLLYKMEHSQKMCKYMLKYGLKDYVFS